jgi:hypothetical protein
LQELEVPARRLGPLGLGQLGLWSGRSAFVTRGLGLIDEALEGASQGPTPLSLPGEWLELLAEYGRFETLLDQSANIVLSSAKAVEVLVNFTVIQCERDGALWYPSLERLIARVTPEGAETDRLLLDSGELLCRRGHLRLSIPLALKIREAPLRAAALARQHLALTRKAWLSDDTLQGLLERNLD